MMYVAVLAGGALLFFYQAFIKHTMPLWGGLIPVAAAIYVLDRRSRAARRTEQLWRLEDLYIRGNARLNREWKDLDPGTNFIDREHSYSSDLDLFGIGSLYQLLCSARTQIGRETLVNWMKAPADPAEIRARQEAIAELRERRDLPELLATAGKTQSDDVRADFVKQWAAEKNSRISDLGARRGSTACARGSRDSLPVLRARANARAASAFRSLRGRRANLVCDDVPRPGEACEFLDRADRRRNADRARDRAHHRTRRLEIAALARRPPRVSNSTARLPRVSRACSG